MSGARLPPGLVDLVLARSYIPVTASRSVPAFNQALRKRLAHSAAALRVHDGSTVDSIVQPAQADRSLYAGIHARRAAKESRVSPFLVPSPRTALTTLEERVQALKNTIATGESVAEESSYSEEELILMYEDLLALPATSKPIAQDKPLKADEECTVIVQSVASRLLPDGSQDAAGSSSQSFSERLWQLRKESGADVGLKFASGHSPVDMSSAPLHIALISRLEDMLHSIQAVQSTASSEGADPDAVMTAARVGLMVETEWKALVSYCLQEHDLRSADKVLDLILRSDAVVSEEILNQVLEYHVDAVDVEGTERLLQKYTSGSSQILTLHVTEGNGLNSAD
ncbi:hypothetical protein NM688_g4226 [Phlebia brevispora]|uniref:Uncharacterized protein n=1 Tax=Phlebia brevispora TaxID=194682 RepID=A0ACC1T3N9_9APHY|nr:hypothetical protein NM688_g4226 [Phlebia brevispora]